MKERDMRTITKNRVILTVSAAALILASSWLVAAGASPAAEPQGTEAGATPLPDFQPTEKLPADSAVAFPTDI